MARHEIQTAGAPVRLVIEDEGILPASSFTADGMSLKYLWVKAVDAAGRVVPTADQEVTVTVSGATELVTLDNGNHYTDELFVPESRVIKTGFEYFGLTNMPEAVITSMTRHLREGRLLVILRSKQKKGNSQVQVTSGFFKPVKTTVKVLP